MPKFRKLPEFTVVREIIKKSFHLNGLKMSLLKNNSLLFDVRGCFLKSDPASLHHVFGKGKRKVKESASKTREVGDQSAHSSSG